MEWITFGEERHSLYDMRNWARDVFQVLSRIGIERGDRLLVQMPNCPQAVAVYLACRATGVIVVPVGPQEAPSHIEYIVRHCNAKAVITQESARCLPSYDPDSAFQAQSARHFSPKER